MQVRAPHDKRDWKLEWEIIARTPAEPLFTIDRDPACSTTHVRATRRKTDDEIQAWVQFGQRRMSNGSRRLLVKKDISKKARRSDE